jgi:pyruvate formate lyase activating enzyme
MPWDEVVAFLDKRRGFLDAVVFSGGEPLFQEAVVVAAAEIKGMGFAVALHTGGGPRERLERLLPHLDWVGFDAKTAFDAYAAVTGVAGSGEFAARSLAEIQAAGIDYEVRTTVDERVIGRDDLLRLADDLAARRVRTWILQECREPGTLCPRSDRGAIFDDRAFLGRLAERVGQFGVRRA